MNETVYKIRRAFLFPLLAIAVLLVLLFLLSLFNRQIWELIVLGILLFASLLAAVDMARKEIIINDRGLKIKKIFRSNEFGWPEITHLGVVVLKKKVYFLLTTTNGFYIFSNLFENHVSLAQTVAEKLGEEKVEPEVKAYLEHPLERLALIVMSWVAVAIIIATIILRVLEIRT